MKHFLQRIVERIARKSELFQKTEQELLAALIQWSRVEDENRQLAERIGAISSKMCNVSVQRHSARDWPKYRIVVDIDAEEIHRGLLHGNDALVIEYIGRDIGYRAAHEIRRANFCRWEV